VVPVKIAILGTRGVPPRYGGFETFAAELGTRLVQRGHDVTVYCREKGAPAWEGIRRVVLPSVPTKYLETVSHTLLSALHATSRDYDVVLLCNAANAFTLPVLRAARIPVAINVDGIERKRRKWNVLGRAVYLIGETLSVSFANAVVADAAVIAAYYRARWQREAVVIPYGAEFPQEADTDVVARLGLAPRQYILYVSRFEPENNPLEVVRAYQRLEEAPPLVMVGAGLYAKDLVDELHRHRSDRVRFPGAIYGADYRTLQRHALFYVQGTEVGGTHPAMIEAMGSGGAVLANDTPENREVGGDAVGYFRLGGDETLTAAMRDWLVHPDRREAYRGRARQRVAARYGWDGVVDAYERLFRTLV
jgi:glycosyltransferase involved in cell wall biosynthesis